MFSSDPAAEECVGIEHGADMFFAKSTPLEELLGAVKALLSARIVRQ
jgi:DNA-binding response OmpR family regulator